MKETCIVLITQVVRLVRAPSFGMLISPVYIAAQVIIYKIILLVNVKSGIIASV